MNSPKKRICHPRQSRLIWTFFLWFLLSMTLTLAGTAAVVGLITFEDINQRVKEVVLREARTARNFGAGLLKLGVPKKEFEELLISVHKRQNIGLTVWKPDGRIEMQVDPQGNLFPETTMPSNVQETARTGKESISWEPGKVWEVVLPVQMAEGQGAFHVRRLHGHEPTEAFPYMGRLWIALAALLILGWLLVWPLAVHLARPLRRIAEVADTLGQGVLEARVEVLNNRGKPRHGMKGEIGLLGESFNQMAENLQRMVEGHKQLLADISHELRTPLARLEVALELAREGNGKQSEYLDSVARQAGRMEDMIGELLAYSRLDSAPYQLKRETHTPGGLFAEAVQLHQEEAEEKRVKILVTGDALETPMSVDHRLILRAVENTLRNAISHSPLGSKVVLNADKEQGSLVLTTADKGEGVAPENLEKIFQPFFRVDTARSPGKGGVGLGLAIARRCVEAHGGMVRADLPDQGTGLRIEFRLPISV